MADRVGQVLEHVAHEDEVERVVFDLHLVGGADDVARPVGLRCPPLAGVVVVGRPLLLRDFLQIAHGDLIGWEDLGLWAGPDLNPLALGERE